MELGKLGKCKIENVKCKMDGARAHLTDKVRSYTEVPLLPDADGTVTIKLQPLSFALVEFK